MAALRLALVMMAAILALAACAASPYSGPYSDSRDSYPGSYYPGTAYPRMVPAPGPWMNGVPTNPGSGGGF